MKCVRFLDLVTFVEINSTQFKEIKFWPLKHKNTSKDKKRLHVLIKTYLLVICVY